MMKPTDAPSRDWKALLLRHEMILLYVLVAEWLFFYFAGTSVNRRGVVIGFGTLDRQFDVLRHSCEIGLLALALTPVIITGGIDLSVGSLLGLCAILFGKLWHDAGLPIPVAAGLTLVIGTLAGGLNAVLVTALRLPPLIVTLGTYSLFRGLAEAITRGAVTYTDFPAGFLFLGQERWLGLPTQAWLFALVALAVWLLVHRTTFGRSYRAIGYSSEGAATPGCRSPRGSRASTFSPAGSRRSRGSSTPPVSGRPRPTPARVTNSLPSRRWYSAERASSAAPARSTARCSASPPSPCSRTVSRACRS